MSSSEPRVAIGIWSEHGAGSRWTNEGMARLVGFLVEGAAESGRVTLRIVIARAMHDEVLADLRGLRAKEGLDWTLHSPAEAAAVAPAALPGAVAPARRARSLPERALRRLLRPILRRAGRQQWSLAAAAAARDALREAEACRAGLLAGIMQGPDGPLIAAEFESEPVCAVLNRVMRDLQADVVAAEAALAVGDLAALARAQALASSHRDDALRLSAELAGWNAPRRAMGDLAEFANQSVPVDAWLVMFPHFLHSLALQGRKTVIFPDMIGQRSFIDPHEDNWGPAGWMTRWRARTALTLAGVSGAVTFSHHIARELAGPPFAFPAERIVVVPHPPPDLRPALPFLADRRGDAGTRGRAAELLQAEAARRGLRYLRDFPFDEVPYCVLSSQDRQTKNIGLVCDAVHRLVRGQRRSIKLITTAPLNGTADWQRLPGFIARQGMQHDICSMHDLDRPEHAALYHCAAVAVHSSFIEGGDTVFPFYEAVSLGTPCLMADGPHVQELLQRAPELAPYVFDPHDADALAALIWQTVQHRDAALDAQLAVFERLSRRRWADAVAEYAAAAIA